MGPCPGWEELASRGWLAAPVLGGVAQVASAGRVRQRAAALLVWWVKLGQAARGVPLATTALGRR